MLQRNVLGFSKTIKRSAFYIKIYECSVILTFILRILIEIWLFTCEMSKERMQSSLFCHLDTCEA